MGLGKAMALAVPEGIRRLFDTIPNIWEALGRLASYHDMTPSIFLIISF